MNNTVCELDKCCGCMACLSVCKMDAISIKDNLKFYNAIIDDRICVKCGKCHDICPNNRELILMQPIKCKQGWAKDENIRRKASSGGLASAIEIAFIRKGGTVCSCTFVNGEFVFKMAHSSEEIEKFAGSKYVKSNPLGIYEKIHKELDLGRDVLFVGLPCQAEAVRGYVGKTTPGKLYTIDLICHGTPSPRLLKDYLQNCGYNLCDLKRISFRHKNVFIVNQNDIPTETKEIVDKYSLAFLCAIDYTMNCYNCRFASLKRGSDLSLGDSWGSDLSLEESSKGISLILCQNERGNFLMDLADLELYDVNIENAVLNNHQLREPCRYTKRTRLFYSLYRGNFCRNVFICLPWKCFKQFIKGVLYKMRIIRVGGGIDYSITIKY